MEILNPLPPDSIIKLVKLWPWAKSKGYEKNSLYKIVYYSKEDGLDCVWLLSSRNKLETADHDWISRFFEVVFLSNNKDYYGDSASVSFNPVV